MVTGGFVTTVWGLRLTARSPFPAFLAAAIFTLVWGIRSSRRGGLAAELASAERWYLARWRVLVGVVALTATLAAVTFNTFSATGSDASGYLSYAALLNAGRLTLVEPMVALASWPDAASALAPLGWRAGSLPGEQVPTYAVGLPLWLAPWLAIGGDVGAGVSIAVTLGLGIVAVAAVGNRLGGPLTAMFAAVWFATSPAALLHGVQVMSDVPVTTAWMICWWLTVSGRPRWAGIAAAIAILIRPNLAPLAIVPLIDGWLRTRRVRDALFFVLPIALSAAAVSYLQWRYFGSPFRSGYGTANEIYSIANVVPNAHLYGTWLIETHGPWLLGAPLVLFSRQRREWAALLLFAAGVTCAYLIYAQFEAWTYLRFLLPALAVAMIAVSFLIVQGLGRLETIARVPLTVTLLLGLAAWNVHEARELGVFHFADRQARGRVVGTALRTLVDEKSVIVSSEHSGTMRYYVERPILRWDLMSPEDMATAVRDWAPRGYTFWVVLDDWEEPAFRTKLGNASGLSIDFAPTVESAGGIGIRARAWRQP